VSVERPSKVRTLGCTVDAVTLDESVDRLMEWLAEVHSAREQGNTLPACRYVVTPNLDHAVMLSKPGPLRAAYREAALVIADGMPLIWASKILGRALPERVAGSDLGPALLAKAPSGTKVFVLGASERSNRLAVEKIGETYPHVNVTGRLSPPVGFERSEEWSEKIVAAIAASEASLLIVGLGAPKQEVWIYRHRERLPGTVALCIGATIDFLAGTVSRAPVWAQKWGVEWVHRLMSDPRRLAKRYGKDALYLPGLLVRDALHKRS
jgi:N-acetylglucosaminyldiphosphoundecaprenol N-acetyl-beta-D-mannosaminyltransferase